MNICEHCGCDKEVEKEMFSQDRLFKGHNCQGDILRVLKSLRQNGVPCFLATDLITPELRDAIKGWG